MLLSSAYFPPTEYFAVLARYSVRIDDSENYQKQTYRNRCRILTSNGVEDLRVPIVHDGKRRITEVRVDYSTDWVRRTKYAIETAYYSSPFFEYYRDELFAILDSQPETLWELNSRITDFFCRKIGIALQPGPDDGEDLRDVIHPKKAPYLKTREYWQVFREKFGFVGNLSVMDLLFNEGPESICILK
ncbi:MAG: WbqC family protein [Bacteroidales bacterium]|nr:WbqC family protein [Bacteroidales bacterium]